LRAQRLSLKNGKLEVGLGLYQYDFLQRQPSQTFTLRGNGILYLKNLEMPLSVQFTNPNVGFQHQPLNRLKLSPTYKSNQFTTRLHLGWHSMIFSPYILAGRAFLGIGGDVKIANRWTIQAGIGRIQTSVGGVVVPGEPFEAQRTAAFPAFERIMQAINAEWRTKNRYYGISWVHAADKVDDRFVPEMDMGNVKKSYHIQPQASVTLELYAKQPLTRSLSVEARFAETVYDRNTTAPTLDAAPDISDKVGFLRFMNYFVPIRTSTQVFTAIDAKLEWNTRILKTPFSMRYRYKRIDPDYKTLVTNYIPNDVEQHWIQGESSGAWTFRGALGFLQNNLHQNKSSQNLKVIADGLVSYDATELGLYQQLSWNYTEINQLPSFYKIRNLAENKDVSVFVKDRDHASYTSNSTQFQLQWVMPNTAFLKQSANAFANYTTYESSRRYDGTTQAHQVRSFVTNVDYQLSLADKHPIGLGLTYQQMHPTMNTRIESWGYSPHAEFYLMDDKLLLNCNYAVSFNYLDGQKDGNSQKLSFLAKYNLLMGKKKNPLPSTFTLKVDYFKNTNLTQPPQAYSELYLHLQYGIRF
jgi:hypothetical protein